MRESCKDIFAGVLSCKSVKIVCDCLARVACRISRACAFLGDESADFRSRGREGTYASVKIPNLTQVGNFHARAIFVVASPL